MIILASTSKIRREILTGAGLDFTVRDSCVDEDKIKAALKGATPSELASQLATAKALALKPKLKEIIIGADQIMEMDGQLFDKPKTIEEARQRLLFMRGKTHRLIGAVTALQKDKQPWVHISITKLFVREYSEEFIDNYLLEEGKDVLKSVGAYMFERRGAQLFDKVEGDFFSILGLPLLPLLAHLRAIGAINS